MVFAAFEYRGVIPIVIIIIILRPIIEIDPRRLPHRLFHPLLISPPLDHGLTLLRHLRVTIPTGIIIKIILPSKDLIIRDLFSFILIEPPVGLLFLGRLDKLKLLEVTLLDPDVLAQGGLFLLEWTHGVVDDLLRRFAGSLLDPFVRA